MVLGKDDSLQILAFNDLKTPYMNEWDFFSFLMEIKFYGLQNQQKHDWNWYAGLH